MTDRLETIRQEQPDVFLKGCIDAADHYEANARAVREKDPYAAHVTEEQKDAALEKSLESCAKLRSGVIDNFTHAQRVYYEITGKSVPLLG